MPREIATVPDVRPCTCYPGEGPVPCEQQYALAECWAVRALRAEAYKKIGYKDAALLDRALAILHRMATEQTGWRALFRRWYYADEPLRNDAANLVREACFQMMQPNNTRLVGDDAAVNIQERKP